MSALHRDSSPSTHIKEQYTIKAQASTIKILIVFSNK